MTVSSPRGIGYSARRLRLYVAELWDRREFAWFLAMGNLKARNASTTLGLFWWVLNPLLLGLVYFLVFGIVFGDRRPPNYVAYLLSAMFAFHFTHHAMTGGANAILQNAKLLINLKFPRLVLLSSSLIEAGAGFLASLVVYYAIAWPVTGIGPSVHALLLLVVIPVHLVFNMGLASMVARMAVPFRDINNFLPYFTRLWLYLSPIIWPIALLESFGPTLRGIIEVNPMFHLIALYRAALIGPPDYLFSLTDLWTSLAWGLALFLLGVGTFVRYETRIVRYL